MNHLRQIKSIVLGQLPDEIFVRVTFKINYLCCGYPRYTEQELNEEVRQPNNPPDEIKFIQWFSVKFTLSQAILNAINLLGLIKNIFFPIYTLLAISLVQSNYRQLVIGPNQYTSANNSAQLVQNLLQSHSSIRFGCLHTNCTKFSDERPFFEDLISLPVFKLCQPHLRAYYYPVLDTSFFGLSVSSTQTYLFFLFGFVAPLALYIWPLTHEVGIFVCVPKTIHSFHGELVRRYLIDRLTSLKNEFYITSHSRASASAHKVFQVNKLNQELDLTPENVQLAQFRGHYNLLSERAQSYINECIPLVRCEEYRPIMSKQYLTLVLTTALYFSSCAIAIFAASYHSTTAFEVKLKQVDNYMSASNCSVWLLTEPNSSTVQTLRVAEPATKWNWYTVSEFLLSFLLSVYLMTLDVAMSLMSLQELYTQIDVQMDRLYVVIEMTDLVGGRTVGGGQVRSSKRASSSFDKLLNDLSFNDLRRLHLKNIVSNYGLVHLKTFRKTISSDLDLRQFAVRSLISYGSSDEMSVFLNFLIKTYITNRCLMHLVRRASRNLTWILLYCYLANYGGVLIVIYFNRKFMGKDYISITFAIFAFVTTSLVLSLASRVQAKSKHLMEQMWQLIAATWHFRDPRVMHMRSLWLKQVIVLSEERGLVLRAFNVPVTYESMIEIAVWSSSLMLLAFSH